MFVQICQFIETGKTRGKRVRFVNSSQTDQYLGRAKDNDGGY